MENHIYDSEQNRYERLEHSVIKNFRVEVVELTNRPAHLHSDYEVACLLQGSVSAICDGITQQFHAPDFLVFNPLSVHAFQAERPAVFLTVQLLSSFFREYYPAINEIYFRFCSGAQVLHYPTEPYFQRIIGFALSAARHYFQMEKGFSLYCAGKLNHLFYDLVQLMPYRSVSDDERQGQSQERLRRITAYIHDNYDKKLLLSQVAEREGLTLSYLSHFFKEHFQMTFQEYLMQLRCEKARQLLLQTDMNMLEICMECGFSDTKYLNQGFQKFYGLQPRELRILKASDTKAVRQSLLIQQRIYTSEEAQDWLKRFEILGNLIYCDNKPLQ